MSTQPVPKEWTYPYFSEFEFMNLCPDMPYAEPGDALFDNVIVRDFEEALGPRPKIFKFEEDDVLQLLPVEIVADDGSVEHDLWIVTISDAEFVDEDELEDYED